ncbi:hypothetical protein SASC598O02_000020, partial [Snodgrassella alvi SCGC AB-598-O02]
LASIRSINSIIAVLNSVVSEINETDSLTMVFSLYLLLFAVSLSAFCAAANSSYKGFILVRSVDITLAAEMEKLLVRGWLL